MAQALWRLERQQAHGQVARKQARSLARAMVRTTRAQNDGMWKEVALRQTRVDVASSREGRSIARKFQPKRKWTLVRPRDARTQHDCWHSTADRQAEASTIISIRASHQVGTKYTYQR